MSARENILNRLSRGALQSAAQKASPYLEAAPPTVEPSAATSAQMRQEFIDNLVANHARVIETSASQLAAEVSNLLDSEGVTQLLGSAKAKAMLHGAPELLSVEWQALPTRETEAESKARLFNRVPAAITTATGGIAKTGSLVLIPDTTEPRSLSLVPPTHLVIIREQDLQPDLDTLVRLRPWGAQMPTNIVLVSGPSKTADIQQTLAYGAHGPSKFAVFLVAGCLE